MLSRTSTVSHLKRTNDRPVSTRGKSGVIVSKNSHRVWCIIKVQSVVRRWLAIRQLKKLKLEKQQRDQQEKEIKELSLTPSITAIISDQPNITLSPVGIEFKPISDDSDSNADDFIQQDRSTLITTITTTLSSSSSSSSSSTTTTTTNELKPIEDDELSKDITSSFDEKLNISRTSANSGNQDSRSYSIDSSAESTPPHSSSRSSSISSCVSSLSVASSPAALITHHTTGTTTVYSTANKTITTTTLIPSPATFTGTITPSISSPSLLENPKSTPTSPKATSAKASSSASPAAPPLSPVVSRRKKTIDEMVYVEKGYVADMNTIIEVFYQSLKDTNLLTDENLFTLFANIKELKDVHTKLLEKFENCISNWNETTTVGDLFLPFMGDFQKLYEVYINNYEKAFAYTKYLKTNSAIVYKKILAGECNDRCRNLDFGSFIVMPVQRLPRYIIFLKEIEKYTAPDHPDTNMSALALCQLHDLTLYLNESKRVQSENDKIAEIKSIINGADEIIGNSKYIMEGQLSLLKGVVASTKKDLFVYLFKDCIICTENHNNKSPQSPRKHHHSKSSKSLAGSSSTHSTPPVLSPQPSSLSLSLSSSSHHSNNSLKRKTLFKTILFSDVKAISVLKNFKDSFQVVTSKKVYTFVAPSTEFKDKWMNALTECQMDNHIIVTKSPAASPKTNRRSIQLSTQTPLSPQWKR